MGRIVSSLTDEQRKAIQPVNGMMRLSVFMNGEWYIIHDGITFSDSAELKNYENIEKLKKETYYNNSWHAEEISVSSIPKL